MVASPTMHSEEILMFVTEAYETNWMSTVGQNINEVERIAAGKGRREIRGGLVKLYSGVAFVYETSGDTLYGKPAIGHGALEGRRVIAV